MEKECRRTKASTTKANFTKGIKRKEPGNGRITTKNINMRELLTLRTNSTAKVRSRSPRESTVAIL